MRAASGDARSTILPWQDGQPCHAAGAAVAPSPPWRAARRRLRHGRRPGAAAAPAGRDRADVDAPCPPTRRLVDGRRARHDARHRRPGPLEPRLRRRRRRCPPATRRAAATTSRRRCSGRACPTAPSSSRSSSTIPTRPTASSCTGSSTGLSPALIGLGAARCPRVPIEARNDTSEFGWFGPCPPDGETHRYVFTLYALSDASGVEQGAGGPEAIQAITSTPGCGGDAVGDLRRPRLTAVSVVVALARGRSRAVAVAVPRSSSSSSGGGGVVVVGTAVVRRGRHGRRRGREERLLAVAPVAGERDADEHARRGSRGRSRRRARPSGATYRRGPRRPPAAAAAGTAGMTVVGSASNGSTAVASAVIGRAARGAGAADDLRGGRPVRRLHGRHGRDGRGELGRKLVGDVRTVVEPGERRHQPDAVEGPRAGRRLEHDETEAVDVGGGTDRLALAPARGRGRRRCRS